MKNISLGVISGFFIIYTIFIPTDASACGMTASITVNVPNPGVVCVGDFITISANVNGGTAPYTYSWSNGMNTPSFSVPAPYSQTLILNVTDATGCTALAILHIKVDVLDFYIGYSNQPLCQGDTLALIIATTVTLPGLQYLWSTGATTPIIYVTTSGTYTATLSHPSLPCVATHSVTVSFSPTPAPNPQIVGPATICPGQLATLTVSGGPFSSYSWSTGSNAPSIQITDPGLYTVIVENATGCTGEDEIQVLPGSIPPPVLAGPSSLCPGQSGTIAVTNAFSYTSFLWSTGAMTPTISINAPGSYSVTVTNAGGCSAEGVWDVVPGNANLTLNGAVSAVTSCTSPNGAVNLTVTPPGSYTFAWSNGAMTEDISNLAQGSYTVTVTNASGCSANATFSVGNNTVLPVPNASPQASTCGQANGAVNLTVNPPGNYSFLWSNGATTQNLSGISPGSYSVTVTGPGGCTGTITTTVGDNSFVPAITGTASPNSSCISANGSVSISVSPAGTYSFNWSNGATSQNIANLEEGAYSVTVSAGGSCVNSASFVVATNAVTPVLSAVITPSVCGLPDGAVDLSVSPSGAYQFIWSTGAFTEDLTGLFGGSYSVTVTSVATGCFTTGTFIVPSNSGSFSITGVASPVTQCGQPNGGVDLTILPPGVYSYSWSNGSTAEDLSNIQAGAYTVTVTQAGSCSGEASFTVEEQLVYPSLSFSATNAVCGLANGAADLSVSPSAFYDFLWSNGNTNEDLVDVPGGNYSVTVTGTNGCTATGAVGIPNQQTVFTLSASVVPNTSCVTNNGAIDLDVAPAGNYSYLWSNGAVSQDLQNIPAGSYTVTVTEGISCDTSMAFEVQDDSGAPVLSLDSSPSLCGENNGSATMTVSAQGGYEVLWSTGDTTEILQALDPGGYSVTVTGENGCMSTDSVTVADQLVSFSVDGTIVPNTSCAGGNGSIDLALSMPGNYSFLWSNGDTTQHLQNLDPGGYAVTVTLGVTCDFTTSYEVPDSSASPVLSSEVIPAICGQSNGEINLNVFPETGNTFLWSNGATTEDLQNIPPGIYSVVCSGANGCPAADTLNVPNTNNEITLSLTSAANTSCVTPNGTVDLTVTPAGGYTFLWSNGVLTEDLAGVSAGDYAVTVTDLFGCSDSVSVAIEGPVTPVVGITGSPAACLGDTVFFAASAGFLTYIWSNGAEGVSIPVAQEGTYAVTATDSNGCVASDSLDFQILPLPAPSIDGPGVDCGEDAVLHVIGGNFPQIAWSTGGTADSIIVFLTGTYTVTVTNTAGCSAAVSHFLVFSEPPLPVVIIDTSNCNGTAVLDAGEGYASYLWSNGSDTQVISVSTNGAYSVTVTDAIGCAGTAMGSLVIPQAPQVSIQGAAGICPGDETGLTASGNNIAQYLWSTGGTGSGITITQGGNYSVTVTGPNGCMATDDWTVGQLQNDMVLIQSTSCFSQDTGVVQLVLSNQFGCDSVVITQTVLIPPVYSSVQLSACEGGSALYNGVEVPAGTTMDFVFSAASGCDSIVSLTVLTLPPVAFTLGATPSCWNEDNGSIDVSGLSGSPPFIFSLDGGPFQNDPFFTGLPGGIHTVLVEDVNGCLFSQEVQIPETQPLEVIVEDQVISCEKGEVIISPQILSGNPNDLFWTWPDGSHNPWLRVSEAGVYSVMVDDGCEVQEIQARVSWQENFAVTDLFYIPNCFSPNNDGINDEFRVYPGNDFEVISFEFKVFDRWGDAMFATTDPAIGWDGLHRGVQMQPAVFVWYVKAKVLVCGSREVNVFKEGGITIVR